MSPENARVLILSSRDWSFLFLQYVFEALWFGSGLSRVEDVEGQITFGEFRILRIHAVVIVAAACYWLLSIPSSAYACWEGDRAVSEDKEASY